ncbi:MAG TPA: acyl-CoA synthetase [Acidimicrobiales bacterium]|nr:acyl-CoA synthetase [Acidimicrobiales bacterium]
MDISDHARSAPRSIALIDSDSESVITYGDLYERALEVGGLLHEAGLRRGDAVALMLPNRPEFLEVSWGCQLSGLYYTPINTHLTLDEVAYIVDDSEARAVFIDGSMAALAAELSGRHPRVEVNVVVGEQLPGWRPYEEALASTGPVAERSDGCEMLYSSGTTGRPKAVRRPLPEANGSWAQSVLEMALTHRYAMTATSVYLSPAPLYHAAGVNYTMAVQRMGAASILMGRFDPERVLELIERHRVTHAQFVPTMFVRMLKLPPEVRGRYDVSSLECVLHAAAPCPVDVKHQMMDWFGPVIHEYYGGTEGFAGSTIGPEEWLAHPGSVGKPLTSVHIVGSDGEELPAGTDGEIYFEGGPTFEYFKDPDKTASVSNDRGWRTLGDIGHVDPDGYLYLTDRSTFMIVSGGVNIYPQEAENVLVMHPKVADAAVFGVPNDEFGEEVKAVIEPLAGVAGGPDLAEELMTYCRDHLAGYKCPRSIDFGELPRDPNGKLYKRRIRDRYWQDRTSRIL